MANVLDKIIQWGENEPKTIDNGNSNAVNKKAFNNVMTYLKEIKLQNADTHGLAGQIYELSENSRRKLDEMQEVLLKKNRASDAKGNEELLNSTKALRAQMEELAELLKEVYDRPSVNAMVGAAAVPEFVDDGISQEEFEKLQDAWAVFEERMIQRFDAQKMQMKTTVELELADQEEEVKRAVRESIAVQAEAVTRAAEAGVKSQASAVAQAVSQGFATQTEEVRRAVEEGLFSQTEKVKHVSELVLANGMDEIRSTVASGVSGQTEILRDAIVGGLDSQAEEVNRAVASGFHNQDAVISESIHRELGDFQEKLRGSVAEEFTEYNANVREMNEGSRQVFEDSLENHERMIKKEISLVQEMMDHGMEEFQKAVTEQLEHVRKTATGYAKTAMWASCLALIILFLDILVLK